MNETFTDLNNQALTTGGYIEQMREAYEALERERDALAAHIGSIQAAIVKRIDELSEKLASTKETGGLELVAFFDGKLREAQYWNNEANILPHQSINHIKAQVEEETIEYCAKCFGIDEATAEFVRSMPRKYAKQAGSTVEEGE